jgi:hypothetical protein
MKAWRRLAILRSGKCQGSCQDKKRQSPPN